MLPELLLHLQSTAGMQLARSGHLLPDLSMPHMSSAHADSLVLEMKPKWGKLPPARWISPAHRIKARRSRFQLMQSLKAAKVGSPSQDHGCTIPCRVTLESDQDLSFQTRCPCCSPMC